MWDPVIRVLHTDAMECISAAVILLEMLFHTLRWFVLREVLAFSPVFVVITHSMMAMSPAQTSPRSGYTFQKPRGPSKDLVLNPQRPRAHLFHQRTTSKPEGYPTPDSRTRAYRNDPPHPPQWDKSWNRSLYVTRTSCEGSIRSLLSSIRCIRIPGRR